MLVLQVRSFSPVMFLPWLLALVVFLGEYSTASQLAYTSVLTVEYIRNTIIFVSFALYKCLT